ncbi:efflux RND transporter periplasmic adaptor subunit [Opitutus sp. ER46]|uniref:efflux RND transporter periplasmic adaptor subunit n=1 Tax=Opitutus sp. ER46 TaxID=2161864 RepID=UPI001304AB72|nr:efflux RND transporter periplasmic adaptor subunit [Opitutus sp. ER46]
MGQRSKLPSPVRFASRAILVLALLAGLGWGGRVVWRQISPGLFGNKRAERIPTARVKSATIAEEIVTVGRVRAVFSTELRSEINGRIVKIPGVDGQRVARNEELLKLDQQDIVTQLQEAERNIEAGRLRAQKARSDFTRTSELRKQGLVTTKDFDDSRTALSLAENDSAIYDARAANLRDKLTKTVIRAPHEGTLLLRDLTEGQVITGVGAQNGGSILGEVADLTSLMVRTNVNEIDVARLKVGAPANVRIDPLRNLMLSGTVRRIATSATESPIDRTRVFPVDVVLDTVDPRLRPGMSATVTFTLSRVDGTPSIPLSAVFTTAESVRYVFVRTPTGFTARPVDIGIADLRRVQVLDGLALDDEVALTRPLDFDGEIPAVGPGGATTAGTPTRKANARRGGS